MSSEKRAYFPDWFPPWARNLGRTYYTGNTSMFVLHGNVDDLVRTEEREKVDYGVLPEFLATQVFGSWDLVLYYDMTRPPRALAGANKDRLQQMNKLIERYIGKLGEIPRDPAKVLALINRFLELMLVGKSDKDRPAVCLIMDYAHLCLPSTAVSHTSKELAANLATMMGWARNPYIKKVNFAFCLISEKVNDLHGALVRSAHTKEIELPFPELKDRLSFIEYMRSGRDFGAICEVQPQLLAELTAGLTLVNLQGLLQGALRHKKAISLDQLKDFKKEMIEGACQGMVEFVEPSHHLDMVVGHVAAKRRLREDGQLIRRGHLDAAPMGYLLCGPVGTGKSFLAECYTGTIGISCLKLLNFRSKYVGETEGNLEKILKVLRVMGPVVVMIDEADAALGNRGQSGDSGTQNRVFAQIASQMGNTQYRGKIVWFLMTCRPDLLPIDIKRQGRAEVHIALFYPQGDEEIREMFVVMGKKSGVKIRAEDVPDTGGKRLSGADVEGVVNRARRLSLLEEAEQITAAHLKAALDGFIPSAEDAEKRMQEMAAVIECTEADMLPPKIREKMLSPDGKADLQRRFEMLRVQLEA